MCGIVAEHGGSDPDRARADARAYRPPRARRPRHRSQVDGSWLGHRRLSIVDVEGGQQPLEHAEGGAGSSATARSTTTRRPRRGSADRELLTDSDNEVALHLLDERGPDGARPAQRHVRVRDGRPTTAASSPPATRSASSPSTGRSGTARCASPPRCTPSTPSWQAARRAVPARLRVDAGGRAGALRLRRARTAARAGRRREDAARPARARRSIARRRAPDDGRRARRRVPLRRAGLDAGRRDRRPRSRERGERLQTFAVGTEGSPDLAAARDGRRAPRHRAPRDHLHARPRRSSRCPTSCARSSPSTPGSCAAPCRTSCSPRMTRQHVKVVLTGEGADELFAGYDYLREFTEADDLHAELERTVARAAQPQPAALRPRDDGPRPRGARAVPGPRGDRLGAARCRPRRSSPGRACRRSSCCARRSRAGCRTSCCGAKGRVRRRQRRARRAERGGRGRRSPTRSSRPSAARSSRRCAPRRSSPTTGSGASTSRASAPSARSAASPARKSTAALRGKGPGEPAELPGRSGH